MAARIPGLRRTRYLDAADVAAIRLVLDLHAAAECDIPSCPVTWLAGFLASLQDELAAVGDAGRAQLWASMFRLPPTVYPAENWPAPRGTMDGIKVQSR